MTPTPNELERLLIELRHSAHANASLSGKPVTDQVEWLALHKIEQLEAQNKRQAEALAIIEAGHGCPSAVARDAINPNQDGTIQP